MTNEVMVVDYGVGNLHSVARALEHCDARVTFSSDPEQVRVAAKVILPGVGALRDALEQFRRFAEADFIPADVRNAQTAAE